MDILSYLDKYVTAIREPMDVIKLFAEVKKGRRHLWLALRNLFNYLEVIDFNVDYLNSLRKALPKVTCNVDLKVPSEDDILNSLGRLERAPLKYNALYNLLLDSGLRLVEADRVINDFHDVERINGFYRCELGYFRGSKQAYYAYFTEYTLKSIKDVDEPLIDRNASHYFKKYGYVAPKYLRKFAFDKMIELEIPESVADFIEGRVPQRIGARHYMALMRHADKFYVKYAEYVISLRDKAGLKVLS